MGVWQRWGLVALLALGSLTAAPGAGADSKEPSAEVRNLAAEGVELFKAEKYDDAIDRFRKANEKFPAPQYLVYIARALVKKGKLLEAKDTYGRAATMKLPEDAPESFSKAQATAATELASLLKRIPVVEIIVQGPPIDKARVTVDDKAVPAAAIVPGSSTLRLELDPGSHAVAVEAAGFKPANSSFTATERDGDTTVRVVLPLVVDAAGDSTAGPAVSGSSSTGHNAGGVGSATAGAGSAGSDIGTPLRVLGGTLTGIGLAGVIAGAISGGIALDRKSVVEGTCPDPHDCSDEGVTIAQEGKTASVVSTVTFIAGGVVAAAGVVILIAAPRPAPAKKPLALTIGPSGVALRGSF